MLNLRRNGKETVTYSVATGQEILYFKMFITKVLKNIQIYIKNSIHKKSCLKK